MVSTCLKPYAASNKGTLIGREYPAKVPTLRSEFERDRDRILHSKAFKRLSQKSQVFIYYGDHHRSRLTHTLEVESISNSIASVLGLNLPLTSSIALAHDLGATPFGKTGELVLDKLMKDKGLQGFGHNHQGIRVVEGLEKQYPDYNGLNLTLAVKEGILKHRKIIRNFLNLHSKHLTTFTKQTKINIPSTLEAQAAKVADDIAETYHYVEDGLRYNLIPIDEIIKSELWQDVVKFLRYKYKISYNKFLKDSKYGEDTDIKKLTVCRFLIKFLVTNVLLQSKIKLKNYDLKNLQAGEIKVNIIDLEEDIREKIQSFYDELIVPNIFKNSTLILISKKCEKIISEIFLSYMTSPEILPHETLTLYKRAEERDGNFELRVLCDHISGMTDRYAIKTYKDMFDCDQNPFPQK